jgi:hypothetical protein
MNSKRFLARPLVLVAAAALALGAAQTAGASSSYTDPAGDSGTAPDITAVSVSDDASGQIVFTIETPGTADLTGSQNVIVPIDSDQNPSTGRPASLGADYMFGVDQGGWGFARWNGSAWDWTAPSTTVQVYVAGGVRFSVNRSELGGTSAFNFWTRAYDGDGNVGHFDDGPDDGTWSYTLSNGTQPPSNPPATTTEPTTTAPTTTAPPPTPVPKIAALIVPPRSIFPKAGRTFRFVVSSVRLDSGAVVAPTSVTCTARLGGFLLRGTGKGGCTFLLAKSARGKWLVVVAKVTYQTASLTQKFPLKVA